MEKFQAENTSRLNEHRLHYPARQESNLRKTAGTFGETYKTFVNAALKKRHAMVFEALKLAHVFRKKVKDHDNSPFLVVILVAIAIDFADSTWLVGLVFKPFLFYFLWGKGTLKVKLTLRVLLLLDCIPFVSWLPLSTIAVLYAWKKSAKEAEEARRKLGEIDQLVTKSAA